jgi:hypothetical protein
MVVDALGEVEVSASTELADDDLEFVDALVELGVPRDAAHDAVVEKRVPLVLAAVAMGEEPRWTLGELAEHSGVPADVIAEVRGALGMPLPDGFSDADLRYVELLARLLEVMPVSAVVRSARARGAALAAVARSDLSTIRDELVLPMRKAGADDLTVSVALAETAKALEPVARELLERTYRSSTPNCRRSRPVPRARRSRWRSPSWTWSATRPCPPGSIRRGSTRSWTCSRNAWSRWSAPTRACRW